MCFDRSENRNGPTSRVNDSVMMATPSSMRRRLCLPQPSCQHMLQLHSCGRAASSATPMSPSWRAVLSDRAVSAAPQPLVPLSHEQISSFRQNGYLIVDGLFRDAALSSHSFALQAALRERGDQVVPPVSTAASTRNDDVHQPAKYQLDVNVSEYRKAPTPTDGTEVPRSHMRPGGRVKIERDTAPPDAKFGRRRTTIRCRTDKEFDRVYKRMKRMQKEHNDSRGISQSVKELEKKGENVTDEDGSRVFDEYIATPQFREQILSKYHVNEVTGFFEHLGKASFHLWHGHPGLREVIRGPIGGVLSRAAGELGGFIRTRMFTDSARMPMAWGNTLHMHAASSFLDFSDPRTVVATVSLPPIDASSSQVAATGRGGKAATPAERGHMEFVVIEGSHHIMRRLISDSSAVSVFNVTPAGWDPGDVVRPFASAYATMIAPPPPSHGEPQERGGAFRRRGTSQRGPAAASSSAPRVQWPAVRRIELPPGRVVFTSADLVTGFTSHITPSGPTGGPLLHSVTLMPDGAVFNGKRLTWMSKGENAPLRHYVAGDPLRDDSLFPLLYSALHDPDEAI